MKLVWSPELALEAYIDTVRSCEKLQKPGVAEFVAALAAGWNARLIVEIWSEGKGIATSIGLNIASNHTGGRHVCILPNARSRLLYLQALGDSNGRFSPPEIIVGEPERVVEQLKGIDFFMADTQETSFATVVRQLELSHGGAVLVCQNACSKTHADFSWGAAFGDGKSKKRVCSLVLPVGEGLEIVHLSAVRVGLGSGRKWIRHIDRKSGVEYAIRK